MLLDVNWRQTDCVLSDVTDSCLFPAVVTHFSPTVSVSSEPLNSSLIMHWTSSAKSCRFQETWSLTWHAGVSPNCSAQIDPHSMHFLRCESQSLSTHWSSWIFVFVCFLNIHYIVLQWKWKHTQIRWMTLKNSSINSNSAVFSSIFMNLLLKFILYLHLNLIPFTFSYSSLW